MSFRQQGAIYGSCSWKICYELLFKNIFFKSEPPPKKNKEVKPPPYRFVLEWLLLVFETLNFGSYMFICILDHMYWITWSFCLFFITEERTWTTYRERVKSIINCDNVMKLQVNRWNVNTMIECLFWFVLFSCICILLSS